MDGWTDWMARMASSAPARERRPWTARWRRNTLQERSFVRGAMPDSAPSSTGCGRVVSGSSRHQVATNGLALGRDDRAADERAGLEVRPDAVDGTARCPVATYDDVSRTGAAGSIACRRSATR